VCVHLYIYIYIIGWPWWWAERKRKEAERERDHIEAIAPRSDGYFAADLSPSCVKGGRKGRMKILYVERKTHSDTKEGKQGDVGKEGKKRGVW
jgi:hypothetical protein